MTSSLTFCIEFHCKFKKIPKKFKFYIWVVLQNYNLYNLINGRISKINRFLIIQVNVKINHNSVLPFYFKFKNFLKYNVNSLINYCSPYSKLTNIKAIFVKYIYNFK